MVIFLCIVLALVVGFVGGYVVSSGVNASIIIEQRKSLEAMRDMEVRRAVNDVTREAFEAITDHVIRRRMQ